MSEQLEILDDVPAGVVPIVAPHGKSFAADASWTIIGQIFYSACMLGWMSLISKFSSDDSRGRDVLATASANPIVAFAALGLRQMLATDVRHEHKFSWYLNLRIVCAVVALTIIIGIALFQPWTVAAMMIAVGVFKTLEMVSDILFGRMQQFSRFDRIALSQIIRGLTTLVCLAIGLFFTHDALGAAIGLVMGFLLTLAIYDFPTAHRIAWNSANVTVQQENDSEPTSGSAANVGKFLWHAAPLAFATTLVSLNLNMPIYFLRGYFHKESEPMIGVFGALNYLPQVGNILMNALGVAASTRLARLYSDGRLRQFTPRRPRAREFGFFNGGS